MEDSGEGAVVKHTVAQKAILCRTTILTNTAPTRQQLVSLLTGTSVSSHQVSADLFTRRLITLIDICGGGTTRVTTNIQ